MSDSEYGLVPYCLVQMLSDTRATMDLDLPKILMGMGALMCSDLRCILFSFMTIGIGVPVHTIQTLSQLSPSPSVCSILTTYFVIIICDSINNICLVPNQTPKFCFQGWFNYYLLTWQVPEHIILIPK
jgi:hypothetical protein